MLYFSSDPERPFPVHCTALRAKVNYSWILQRESVEICGHFPISHPVLRCQHILKPTLKLSRNQATRMIQEQRTEGSKDVSNALYFHVFQKDFNLIVSSCGGEVLPYLNSFILK